MQAARPARIVGLAGGARQKESVMRNTIIVAAALAAFAACTIATAQDGKALDGRWTAQWPTKQSGQTANAEMNLRDSSGTWRAMFAHSEGRMNVCLEKEHPATVKPLPGGRYRLAVEASKTMPSCQNVYATLELVDPTHLVGKWDNGQELKLVRK